MGSLIKSWNNWPLETLIESSTGKGFSDPLDYKSGSHGISGSGNGEGICEVPGDGYGFGKGKGQGYGHDDASGSGWGVFFCGDGNEDGTGEG